MNRSCSSSCHNASSLSLKPPGWRQVGRGHGSTRTPVDACRADSHRLRDLLHGRWPVDFEAVEIPDIMSFGSVDGPLPSPNPSFGGIQHLVP